MATASGHREAALLVCGSLQSRSANRAVLDVAQRWLRSQRVETDRYEHLGDLPTFNPDTDPGHVVGDWWFRIARAGVVLIAAPEYAGALSGVMKNALDWIVGSGELNLKIAGVVSAGTNGAEHAQRMLVQTLTWRGAHVVADLGITAPRTKTEVSGVSPTGQRSRHLRIWLPLSSAQRVVRFVTGWRSRAPRSSRPASRPTTSSL